jgi:hypothetical protein
MADIATNIQTIKDGIMAESQGLPIGDKGLAAALAAIDLLGGFCADIHTLALSVTAAPPQGKRP